MNNFDGPPLGMMCFQTPFLLDYLLSTERANVDYCVWPSPA
jgi:hypothetical protein